MTFHELRKSRGYHRTHNKGLLTAENPEPEHKKSSEVGNSLLKGIHSSRSRGDRMPTGWAGKWKALKLHEKDLWQILHSYKMSKGQKVGGLDG